MTSIFLEDLQFQLKGKTGKQLNKVNSGRKRKFYFIMKIHLQKCYHIFLSLPFWRKGLFSLKVEISIISEEKIELLQMQYSLYTRNIASERLIKACFRSISMMDVYAFHNENILWGNILSLLYCKLEYGKFAMNLKNAGLFYFTFSLTYLGNCGYINIKEIYLHLKRTISIELV